MAIVTNLDLAQQMQLENIFKDFKLSNPDIEYQFFNQVRPVKKEMFTFPEEVKKEMSAVKSDNSELENKIDALNRKLDLIFGNHILIHGKMVDIEDLK